MAALGVHPLYGFALTVPDASEAIGFYSSLGLNVRPEIGRLGLHTFGIGSVDEVAGAIAFLLSPVASLITGSSLLVDGRWTAQ
jgi:NAD(P)-dependent dehydrogenase (short-subunit alcohol dehydrogenase family)